MNDVSHPSRKMCPFCGQSAPQVKFSNEHVMRAALKKYFRAPLLAGITLHQARLEEDLSKSAVRSVKELPIGPFDMTVNKVCKACNEGWMNFDVEMPAEQLLADLIQGLDTYIGVANGYSLALWAAKTACVRALFETGQSCIPVEHYAHLKNTLTPPPFTFVWVARVDNRASTFMRHVRMMLEGFFPGEKSTAHLTTIIYGHMALYVLGCSSDYGLSELGPIAHSINERDTMMLWPLAHSAKWPFVSPSMLQVGALPRRLAHQLSTGQRSDMTLPGWWDTH